MIKWWKEKLKQMLSRTRSYFDDWGKEYLSNISYSHTF